MHIKYNKSLLPLCIHISIFYLPSCTTYTYCQPEAENNHEGIPCFWGRIKLIWPANRMRSTRLLVDIHNKQSLNSSKTFLLNISFSKHYFQMVLQERRLDNLKVFVQREHHDTEILKRLQPGLVQKTSSYKQKTGSRKLVTQNKLLASPF